jgi:recombination protein RecT
MLVRDGSGGLEVYLMRRTARSSFMPGAYVFPGGAVDPADGSPAALELLYGDAALPDLTVAAIRETFEEAGLLLVCDPAGEPAALDDTWLRTAREALHRGAPFVETIARRGLRLDARALHPYSNWITPENEPKRFDTFFFVARAPHDQAAEADAREVHDGLWLAPSLALERSRAGELAIVFPTLKHLERLASYESAEAALAGGRRRIFAPLLPVMTPAGEVIVPEGAW